MATHAITHREIPLAIPEAYWEEAGELPCRLSVDLALRRFTVRDLLQLAAGAIVESENANGADVPVVVNTRVIGWAEFEVVGQKLAVRITGLA